MADVGWEGVWKPMIVGTGTINELKDLAGAPVLSKGGRPEEWCIVNLRTGEFRYPSRSSN